MKKFKDITGHEWELQLLFGDIMRVKEASGGRFDLLDPTANDLSKKLDVDLAFFWELLVHLVEPQAAAAGIAEHFGREFGQRMAGRCIIEAQQAFFAEWADFFHQLQRPDLATALETTVKLNALTVAKVKERLERDETIKTIPQRAERKIDAALTTALSGLRESCDSILKDTPGASCGSATKESSDKPGRCSSRKRTSCGPSTRPESCKASSRQATSPAAAAAKNA